MKAEHNSIISGSAMAVLIGIIFFIGCWFIPVSFGIKIFLAIVGVIAFIFGLNASKG